MNRKEYEWQKEYRTAPMCQNCKHSEYVRFCRWTCQKMLDAGCKSAEVHYTFICSEYERDGR